MTILVQTTPPRLPREYSIGSSYHPSSRPTRNSPAVSSPSQTIHLITRDDDLARRVRRAFGGPVVRTRRVPRVDSIGTDASVVVVHAPRLDHRWGDRIEWLALRIHRPVAVLCGEADPTTAFQLGRRLDRSRLVGVATDRRSRGFRRRLLRWSMADTLVPDWAALGLPREGRSLIGGFQSLIEGEPARNWAVQGAADRLGVSRTTLGRAIRDATGAGPKSLLIDLRRQLIERAQREARLGSRDLARIFDFRSPAELHRWRSRHRER